MVNWLSACAIVTCGETIIYRVNWWLCRCPVIVKTKQKTKPILIVFLRVYFVVFLFSSQSVSCVVCVFSCCCIIAHALCSYTSSSSVSTVPCVLCFCGFTKPPSPLQVTTCSWLRCTSSAMPSVWNTRMTPLLSWLLSTSTWTQRTSNYLTTTYRASRKSMVTLRFIS